MCNRNVFFPQCTSPFNRILFLLRSYYTDELFLLLHVFVFISSISFAHFECAINADWHDSEFKFVIIINEKYATYIHFTSHWDEIAMHNLRMSVRFFRWCPQSVSREQSCRTNVSLSNLVVRSTRVMVMQPSLSWSVVKGNKSMKWNLWNDAALHENSNSNEFRRRKKKKTKFTIYSFRRFSINFDAIVSGTKVWTELLIQFR